MSEDEASTGLVRPSRTRRAAVAVRLGWLTLIGLGFLVPLAGRVAFEGRAELVAANAARDAGDFDLEVEHLGRAARWRLPAFSHDEVALDQLFELGRTAEARGASGSQDALAAYREIRSALLATRAWSVPHRALLDVANEHIARLMADQERRFKSDLGGRGDPYAYHLGLLQTLPGPDPVRANLGALAFVAWLGSVAGFVLRALDARGRLRAGPAVRWGLSCLALLVCWATLLRFAG